MLVILSPAKLLNFEEHQIAGSFSNPVFAGETQILVRKLQTFSSSGLQKLMSLSSGLGHTNYERYQTWDLPETPQKAAILTFNGEVYNGLRANELSFTELNFSQNHLRILSGLYGVLKPFDLIKPHRLEMGTKLKINGHPDLYSFWKEKVTREINDTLGNSGSPVLINLASQEYFKSLDTKKLNAQVVNVDFKEFKEGQYKTITIYAKKARGLLARFILQNQITRQDDLPAFDSDGYVFSPAMSKKNHLVFTRDR